MHNIYITSINKETVNRETLKNNDPGKFIIRYVVIPYSFLVTWKVFKHRDLVLLHIWYLESGK